MTCFWDGILRGLRRLGVDCKECGSAPKLAQFLIDRNVCVEDVKWNGVHLCPADRRLHFESVANYDMETMGRGYDCSACDPFLFMVAQVFVVSIEHDYNGVKIEYTREGSEKVLRLRNDRGHLTCV